MSDAIHREYPFTYVKRRSSYFSWSSSPYTHTSSRYVLPLSTFDGVKNPNWKSQVANKSNATTPMQGTITTVEQRDAVLTASWRTKSTDLPYEQSEWGDLTSFNGSTQAFSPTDLQEAVDMASTNMLNMARDAQQRLGSLVILGEAKESLHLIRDNSWRVLNMLSAYCRRLKKVRRMKKALEQATNMWLELQFGLTPLLKDVDQASRTLQELANAPHTEYVWGRGRANSVVSDITSSKSGANYHRYFERIIKESKASCQYLGEVKAGLDSTPSSLLSLSDLLGLGPGDFIPSVWELIPYSFVVDYFSNVGDVLTHTFSTTPTFAWSCKTTKEEGIVRYILRVDAQGTRAILSATPNFKNVNVSGNDGETTVTLKRVIRVSATPSVPSFHFKLPKMGTKWLNLTALLHQHRELLPFN